MVEMVDQSLKNLRNNSNHHALLNWQNAKYQSICPSWKEKQEMWGSY